MLRFFKSLFNKNSQEKILNCGLNFAMEWGANWLQPIQARLKKRYHYLTDDELDYYNNICKEAMTYGHNLIEELAPEMDLNKVTFELWKVQYIQKYKWTSKSNLGRLYSQGQYYARK